jgi:hypothetical protein
VKYWTSVVVYGIASVCGVSSTVAEIMRGDVLLSSLDAVPAAVCIVTLAIEAAR